MRSLKFIAYILVLLVIIAATSYATICMANTTIYKKIAYNLATNIGDFLGGDNRYCFDIHIHHFLVLNIQISAKSI